MLLTVRNLRKHYGPNLILSGIAFAVREGERIGLVGPNGCGKTTLLRVLSGQEESETGEVSLQTGARFGYLEQQPDFPLERSVWDLARAALEPLLRLQREAQEVAEEISRCDDPAQARRLGERFDRLQHLLQHHDAYHVDHRVERVLQGLGFQDDEIRRPAATLSGGQLNRLMLARLLLEEPDLLLLDEPSNHLDLAATEWLEEFLVQSGRAMILVSHDRFLLDRVTNRTLELFHATVEDYAGNFSAYRRQKAERLEVQRRTYERQQAEIERLKDFVRRNHYGLKHAQAEDRRRKLERIERVPPPRVIAAPRMRFPSATRTGDIVIRVEHLAKGYTEPLFEDLTFDILRGEKWGIFGPNGCGKSTLLRCLMGDLAPDDGQCLLGTGVRLAWFDQHLQCLGDDVAAVDAIRPDHKEFHEPQRRDLLARFGLTGDAVFQPVKSLSGGERNRAALAYLAARDANLLVLDEPTNHLDLWAREALEEALRAFDGTVVFVSHDRYFLNQVADHLLVARPGGFQVIEGDYDHYQHLCRRGLAAPFSTALGKEGDSKTETPVPNAGPTKASGSRPRRKFPYRKVSDLEYDIHRCETRVAELHEQLSAPEVLRDGDRVRSFRAELEQVQARLEELYAHWEEAVELN